VLVIACRDDDYLYDVMCFVVLYYDSRYERCLNAIPVIVDTLERRVSKFDPRVCGWLSLLSIFSKD
jgi:hypothetical protein